MKRWRKPPRVTWDALVWADGAVYLEWRYPGTYRNLYLDRTRGHVVVPSIEAAKQAITDVTAVLEGQR